MVQKINMGMINTKFRELITSMEEKRRLGLALYRYPGGNHIWNVFFP